MSNFKDAKTLAEAIEKLENAGENKAHELKQNFEKDYLELKKTVEDLKPHLEELKTKIQREVSVAKLEIEEKVKENPWATLAFVGIAAFTVGCLVGNKNKGDHK